MQDIFLFAGGQRVTDIRADADQLLLTQRGALAEQIAVQRLQFLHANQNGASAGTAENGIVFDRDDIGYALELHHQIDLGTDALQEFFDIPLGNAVDQKGCGRCLHGGRTRGGVPYSSLCDGVRGVVVGTLQIGRLSPGDSGDARLSVAAVPRGVLNRNRIV